MFVDSVKPGKRRMILALAAGLGSYIRYFLFWGNYGRLCLGWSLAALSMALALGGTVLVRQAPLLMPAL